MTRIATLAIAIATLLAAHASAQEKMLHPCESIEGVKISWGKQYADTELSLNTDAAYVSQGKASVRIFSVTQPDAKSNTYIAFRLPVEPVDLKGKAIEFEAWTSRPDTTKALYVRGFNAAGKHVVSWNDWAGPIKKEATTFHLEPGESSQLNWEQKKVEVEGETIVYFDFIAGSSTKGDPMDLYVDNLRLVPAK